MRALEGTALVEMDQQKTETEGGLAIPLSEQKKNHHGTVVDAGFPGLEKGDRVVCVMHVGVEVTGNIKAFKKDQILAIL